MASIQCGKSLISRKCYYARVLSARNYLRQTYGEPFGYAEPFPYKEKKLRKWHDYIDLTNDRLNCNSKIILVEGNIGIGKNDFACRLAKQFDLAVFPSFNNANLYDTEFGFDLRYFNQFLPKKGWFYDLRSFYKEDDDPKKSKLITNAVRQIHFKRLFRYADSIEHMYNTGQGAIVVKSHYSDFVYARTLHKMGYMTDRGLQYYNDYELNATAQPLKPHLIIYLSCPPEEALKRHNAKNHPIYNNSKIVNEEYVQSIDYLLNTEFHRKLSRHAPIYTVDYSKPLDDNDVEIIAREISKIVVDSEHPDETVLQDWFEISDDQAFERRLEYSKHERMTLHYETSMPVMLHCPELAMTYEEGKAVCDLFDYHPYACYDPRFAGEVRKHTVAYHTDQHM